jgi:hypothetical protein
VLAASGCLAQGSKCSLQQHYITGHGLMQPAEPRRPFVALPLTVWHICGIVVSDRRSKFVPDTKCRPDLFVQVAFFYLEQTTRPQLTFQYEENSK